MSPITRRLSAKIGRDRVWEIVAAMNEALDEGRPAVRVGVAAGS